MTATQRSLLVSGVLAIAWMVAIAIAYRVWLSHYYPHSDDWALLAASQPGLADWTTWWTQGLSTYFSIDAQPSNSPFVRPLFNFGYWLLGLFAAPESPKRLWICIVAIGACVAACGFALGRAGERGHRLDVAAAALVPLLPPFLPALIIYTPYLAFDAVAAAICVLAYVAYSRERYGTTALLLLAAVLTKETALPVAAVLPVVFAWQQRAQLRAARRAWITLAMLALPVVCWIALRWIAKPGIVGDHYAFRPEPAAIVQQIATAFWRWPLWTEATPALMGPLGSPLWLRVLAAGNLVILATCAVFVVRDWRRDRSISVATACMLASYAFMLLVGKEGRYGAALWAFLLICLVQWYRSGAARVLVVSALTFALLGIATGTAFAIRRAHADESRLLAHWSDCARYTGVLRAFGPEDRVLVLEDRCTLASHLTALERVAQIRASVYKLSDAYTARRRAKRGQECATTITPDVANPHSFTILQSCGLDLDATAHRNQEVTLNIADGIQATLLPGTDGSGMWRGAYVTVAADVHVLMFDPQSGTYRDPR